MHRCSTRLHDDRARLEAADGATNSAATKFFVIGARSWRSARHRDSCAMIDGASRQRPRRDRIPSSGPRKRVQRIGDGRPVRTRGEAIAPAQHRDRCMASAMVRSRGSIAPLAPRRVPRRRRNDCYARLPSSFPPGTRPSGHRGLGGSRPQAPSRAGRGASPPRPRWPEGLVEIGVANSGCGIRIRIRILIGWDRIGIGIRSGSDRDQIEIRSRSDRDQIEIRSRSGSAAKSISSFEPDRRISSAVAAAAQ
jgi:hypothetical protein